MKGLAVTAVLFLVLISACGPDNPFDPGPSGVAITVLLTGPSTARVRWNASPDDDFYSYTLYRSPVGDIKNNPGAATVLGVFYDRYDKEYYDENLSAGTWYYALKVTNEGGFSTWSNEAGVTVEAEAIRKFDK
jgi:hypothetical protein